MCESSIFGHYWICCSARSGCSRSPRKPRYPIMIVKRCSLPFFRCPNRLEISPKWSEQTLVWWPSPSPMFQYFFWHSQAQLDRDSAVYMSLTIFWVSKSIGDVAWHFGEAPDVKTANFRYLLHVSWSGKPSYGQMPFKQCSPQCTDPVY